MDWRHKCSLAWLVKRQAYITASDIKKLLPVTATGRPRVVKDVDKMKVMASKLINLTEEDCWSYGAAARGHIMEPYAINAFNEMLKIMGSEEYFYWWDDEIVTENERSLAFSPDAANTPPIDDTMTAIAEVKSYSNEKHLAVAYTPKDQIEERWQIASAMALKPNIDHAYLVLFNPRMSVHRLFFIKYERSELKHEIETVLEVEKDWDKFTNPMSFTRPPSGAVWTGSTPTEEDIIQEYLRHQNLNP